jgi:tRNA U34 5-carboxymethylaminomethyl modifying enzyme MnmG/GidA
MFKKIQKLIKTQNKRISLKSISKIELDNNYKSYIRKERKSYKKCKKSFTTNLLKNSQKDT